MTTPGSPPARSPSHHPDPPEWHVVVWPLVVAGRLSAVSGYQDPAGGHEGGAVANRRDRPGSRDTALQISGRTLPNISVCSRSAVFMPRTGPRRYASIRVSRSCNTKQVLEFMGAPSVALDGWTIRVQKVKERRQTCCSARWPVGASSMPGHSRQRHRPRMPRASQPSSACLAAPVACLPGCPGLHLAALALPSLT